jgi:hypothetical protein
MTFQIGISRLARGGFFIVLLGMMGLTTIATAGLSEADRITLDQRSGDAGKPARNRSAQDLPEISSAVN